MESPGSRVALVIGQLTAGGAEGQLALVARTLRQTGSWQPFVYCTSAKSLPIGPELERDGVPVRVFAGSPLARVAALRRAMAQDRIQVVHSWLFIANTYAWLANRGRRPLITSARNCKRQGRAHDTANRFAFRASRHIVANSHQVKDYIEATYRAPSSRIRVIHNGIDVDRFRPAEAPSSPPLILGIGRLVPQKDPLLFVRAAAELARQEPAVRFAFLGEGPLRGEVVAAIAANGLEERFSLPGETRDVPSVLRQAAIFWLTSAWEGLPNVVLEALACGVPVIAADVGGTRELLRCGIEGELVASGDAAAFARHSLALLHEPATHALRASRARARALEFSTAKMVQSMVDLYDDVLRS